MGMERSNLARRNESSTQYLCLLAMTAVDVTVDVAKEGVGGVAVFVLLSKTCCHFCLCVVLHVQIRGSDAHDMHACFVGGGGGASMLWRPCNLSLV